jgi:hypothetical protein
MWQGVFRLRNYKLLLRQVTAFCIPVFLRLLNTLICLKPTTHETIPQNLFEPLAPKPILCYAIPGLFSFLLLPAKQGPTQQLFFKKDRRRHQRQWCRDTSL